MEKEVHEVERYFWRWYNRIYYLQNIKNKGKEVNKNDTFSGLNDYLIVLLREKQVWRFGWYEQVPFWTCYLGISRFEMSVRRLNGDLNSSVCLYHLSSINLSSIYYLSLYLISIHHLSFICLYIIYLPIYL